jgi:hypothetical protein
MQILILELLEIKIMAFYMLGHYTVFGRKKCKSLYLINYNR